MEYFLTASGVTEHDLTITDYVMPCYNTLDDPEFAEDRGDLLAQPSALEIVRDDLSDEQCLEMGSQLKLFTPLGTLLRTHF